MLCGAGASAADELRVPEHWADVLPICSPSLRVSPKTHTCTLCLACQAAALHQMYKVTRLNASAGQRARL